MSCISELLNRKEEINLSLLKNISRLVIEGGGTYRDYEYLITFTNLGYRCGYVAVPNANPAIINLKNEEIAIDILDKMIECHGGVTFFSNKHSLKEELNSTCLDFWIGFDCGHFGDSKDIINMYKYFKNNVINDRIDFPEEIIKTYEYVEDECKSIIDQLINIILDYR